MLKQHRFSQYGGTRFIAVIGCGLVSSLLVYLGAISGDVYQVVILGTVGSYIAGDTTQSSVALIAAKAAKKPESKTDE